MTKQHPDNIRYNGLIGHIEETPLEPYLTGGGLNLQGAGKEFSTALWRGYIADWSVDQGKLFLVKLSDAGFNEIDISLLWQLSAKQESGRILAEWYSGRLTCPRGEVKERHRYSSDVYEFDDLFEIENGHVICCDPRRSSG